MANQKVEKSKEIDKSCHTSFEVKRVSKESNYLRVKYIMNGEKKTNRSTYGRVVPSKNFLP